MVGKAGANGESGYDSGEREPEKLLPHPGKAAGLQIPTPALRRTLLRPCKGSKYT